VRENKLKQAETSRNITSRTGPLQGSLVDEEKPTTKEKKGHLYKEKKDATVVHVPVRMYRKRI
jgi:hypothetical protein